MENETQEITTQSLKNLEQFYFNTPLVKITVRDNGVVRQVYAKYETLQISGSIKDRFAFYVFKEGYTSGAIHPGTKLVEVSSGNTAIALTTLGRLLGHEVTIVLPDWLTPERIGLLKLLGAKLHFTSGENAFVDAITIANEYKEKGYYYPDQFSSQLNVLAHKETTAPELFAQMKKMELEPEYFVAGVGSGGTSAGMLAYIKSKRHHCKSFLLEPEQANTMTTGKKTSPQHLIQGIGDGFIPPLIQPQEHDGVITVDDYASAYVASLINKSGLSVGISSGANLLGAIKIIRQNPGAVVATVFPDCSKKYLSGQLTKNFSETDRLPDIEIIDIECTTKKMC